MLLILIAWVMGGDKNIEKVKKPNCMVICEKGWAAIECEVWEVPECGCIDGWPVVGCGE